MNASLDRLNDKDKIAAREKELQRIKDLDTQFGLDLQKLCGMKEFKRVMSQLLAKGGMMQSVMSDDGRNTSYLAGRQDFTREMWSEIAQKNHAFAFELLKPITGESDD